MSPSVSAEPSRVRVWSICVLLFLATVLNYLDRQVLSLTAEHVIAEFGITKEGLGEVIAAFRYSYAALQIGGGWLVDLLGVRVLFPAALGLWSGAGMLTAFAVSMAGLKACRFLLGIGEAFNWPCALKATQQLLEPKDRALAVGLFNSGTAAGSMLAPLIVTAITLTYGWRASFVVTGALGVFWIAAWVWLTRGFGRQLTRQPAAFRQLPASLVAIAANPRFWLLCLSAVIVNSVSYFLADWIPLYLKTERGFGFASGNAVSILVFAGLDVGNLSVGFLLRRLIGRGVPVARARRVSLVICCFLMTCAAGAGAAPSAAWSVLLLVATALGVAGFLVIYLTAVQDLDPARVGLSAGLLGGLGNLAYGLVSPWIGRLADLRQSQTAFLLVGLLPWLALAGMWIAAAPRVQAPAAAPSNKE